VSNVGDQMNYQDEYDDPESANTFELLSSNLLNMLLVVSFRVNVTLRAKFLKMLARVIEESSANCAVLA